MTHPKGKKTCRVCGQNKGVAFGHRQKTCIACVQSKRAATLAAKKGPPTVAQAITKALNNGLDSAVESLLKGFLGDLKSLGVSLTLLQVTAPGKTQLEFTYSGEVDIPE